MEIPKNPPAWANWFHELGSRAATIPFQESQGKAPRIVVSVPTGQFTTWMIVAGALSAGPPALETPKVDTSYSTWNSAASKMDDCTFNAHTRPNQIVFADHPNTIVTADLWPVKATPEGTPKNRSGAAPRPNLRDELRELPGLRTSCNHW